MSILYGLCDHRNYVYEPPKIAEKNRNIGYFCSCGHPTKIIYRSTEPPKRVESNKGYVFKYLLKLWSYRQKSAPVRQNFDFFPTFRWRS